MSAFPSAAARGAKGIGTATERTTTTVTFSSAVACPRPVAAASVANAQDEEPLGGHEAEVRGTGPLGEELGQLAKPRRQLPRIGAERPVGLNRILIA